MVSTPQRLGDFEIVREIGRGGMGVVYEAVQLSLNRRVALKVLSGGLGFTERAVQRFHLEAAAAAKLHHTNIVPVYATGEAGGVHFYAMELIEGCSLDMVIRQTRGKLSDETTTVPPADLAVTGPYVPEVSIPMPAVAVDGVAAGSSVDRFDRSATMIADVADALQHAHELGVTHRDIKPSNLLLSNDGRLSVTDFGLARVLEQPGMTVTGEFIGTPAYMSPEQVTAGRVPIDHRTDIYSLGATLYELLTLRPQFSADGRDKLLAMVVHEEPVPPRSLDPKVPRDLETICLKCLEKDPERRYQTAKDLADDLRCYVNRFAISAKRAGPLTRVKKWVKRNPLGATAAMAVLLAVGVAAVVAYRSQRADAERLVERRREATDRAILAAMSGQFSEADAALLEAERLGADLAERRFVAGIVSHYRGDAETARRLLLEACGERPDWVAPRAFLAVVCDYLSDWDGEAANGNAALELTPVTAEDYLFRGYMIGLSNYRRGLPDVEEAWSRRRSVLAQFIRAEVLSGLADDTGGVEDADAAREAFRGARAFTGDAPMVSVGSLYFYAIGCNNCRLHGQEDEAKNWLAEGEADFRVAGTEACRNHPASLEIRSTFLQLRDGSAQALDTENREAGRRSVQSLQCRSYLASLLRQRKTDEALEYLKSFPETGSLDLTFFRVVFLLDGHLEAAREECRRAVRSARSSDDREPLVLALSLVGLEQEAREQAQIRARTPPISRAWDDLQTFQCRVFAHAYGGVSMDVEAAACGSRWKQHFANKILGYAALARGDRAGALQWFKADEHIPITFGDRLWKQAVRARVLADDTVWPPWLAAKK
jgi:serine/threonine protein kinase